MNTTQSKLAAQQVKIARNRMAMFLKLHLRGASGSELARKYGMSASRMNLLLQKAKEECKQN